MGKEPTKPAQKPTKPQPAPQYIPLKRDSPPPERKGNPRPPKK
jgi:hypothetical protein